MSSREEPKIIGYINLSTELLIDEDCTGRINFPNGVGQCVIYVYSNEETIPHFHIISNDGKFESCICIYEALYFNHGYKQGKFNSKQRKILNEFLVSQNSFNHSINNWEAIELTWYNGNGDKYIPKKRIQPNYTVMENMRN